MKKSITGIIGAMAVEVEKIISVMKVEKEDTIADMTFFSGTLNDKNVVVVKCGMGKVNAGICAQLLISIFGVDRIINTGVAGSLNNKLNIFDIVISSDAVQHDFTVEFIGFKKGEIPYTGKFAFEADDTLVELALKTTKEKFPEINAVKGRVCSGDQFISEAEQKNRIIDNFAGDCCEMEGGSIAQVCYLNKVPFVIIRAISDKPDETEAVEYPVFEKKAAQVCAGVVMGIIDNI